MATNATSPAENERKLDPSSVVEDALDAFWDVVAQNYPTAKTGDLAPETVFALDRIATDAVTLWIRFNVPMLCKKCGSEIVETINDSNFRDGECGGCEYERYKSQRDLLEACKGVCGMIYRDKNGDERIDFDQYEQAELACRAAITRAEHGNAK